MRQLLLCLIAFLSLTVSQAQTDCTSSPLMIIYAYNPWLGVIGSDPPCFILYKDSSAIYSNSKYLDKYYKVKLTGTEFSEMTNLLTLYKKDFQSYKNYYVGETGDDLGDVRIKIFYSDSAKDVKVSNYSISDKTIPLIFKTIYSTFRYYSNYNSKPWTPDYFEALLAYQSNSKDKNENRWPSDLPPFASLATVSRHSSLISAYIPFKYFEIYKAYQNKKYYSVTIDGKKYTLVHRLPLPCETK